MLVLKSLSVGTPGPAQATAQALNSPPDSLQLDCASWPWTWILPLAGRGHSSPLSGRAAAPPASETNLTRPVK